VLIEFFVKMNLKELHFLVGIFSDLAVVFSLTTLIIIIFNHGRIYISEKLEVKTQASGSAMYPPYS